MSAFLSRVVLILSDLDRVSFRNKPTSSVFEFISTRRGSRTTHVDVESMDHALPNIPVVSSELTISKFFCWSSAARILERD
jgi:hypothetical protein